MVEAARIAYRDYPTVVNEVPESGLTYDNTMEEYARMDSSMQSAQKAIGGSSDSAQLSQSYMWSKVAKGEYDEEYQQLYNNTVILAVLAQLSIDGVKRAYAVNPNDDIKRIRSQDCMKKDKDFPAFMRWTHDIPVTKNGKSRPDEDIKKDRKSVARRIDPDIICPMNWLQNALDTIQGSPRSKYKDTKEFFIHVPGQAHSRQKSKIRALVDDYDGVTKRLLGYLSDNDEDNDVYELLQIKTKETLDELSSLKISKCTMNRLIGSVLDVDHGVRNDRKYKMTSKHTRKMLNLMYKTNKDMFLSFFVKASKYKEKSTTSNK